MPPKPGPAPPLSKARPAAGTSTSTTSPRGSPASRVPSSARNTSSGRASARSRSSRAGSGASQEEAALLSPKPSHPSSASASSSPPTSLSRLASWDNEERGTASSRAHVAQRGTSGLTSTTLHQQLSAGEGDQLATQEPAARRAAASSSSSPLTPPPEDVDDGRYAGNPHALALQRSRFGAPVWCSSDDELIVAMVAKHGQSWQELTDDFNLSSQTERTWLAIRHRWSNIISRGESTPQLEAAKRAATAMSLKARERFWTQEEDQVLREGLAQRKDLDTIFEDYEAKFTASKRSRLAIRERMVQLCKVMNEESRNERSDSSDDESGEGESEDEDDDLPARSQWTRADDDLLRTSVANNRSSRIHWELVEKAYNQAASYQRTRSALHTRWQTVGKRPAPVEAAPKRFSVPHKKRGWKPRARWTKKELRVLRQCVGRHAGTASDGAFAYRDIIDDFYKALPSSTRTRDALHSKILKLDELDEADFESTDSEEEDAAEEEECERGEGGDAVMEAGEAEHCEDAAVEEGELEQDGGAAMELSEDEDVEDASMAEPTTTLRRSTRPRKSRQRLLSSLPQSEEAEVSQFDEDKEGSQVDEDEEESHLDEEDEASQLDDEDYIDDSNHESDSDSLFDLSGANEEPDFSTPPFPSAPPAQSQRAASKASPQTSAKTAAKAPPKTSAKASSKASVAHAATAISAPPVDITYESNGVLVDGCTPGLEIMVYSRTCVRVRQRAGAPAAAETSFSSTEDQPFFHFKITANGGVVALRLPDDTMPGATMVAREQELGEGGGGGDCAKMVLQSSFVEPGGFRVVLRP